jgi:hypothetical protein
MNGVMAKSPQSSAGKSSDDRDGLSEEMRKLILMATVEERRKADLGGVPVKRRRRSDGTTKPPKS